MSDENRDGDTGQFAPAEPLVGLAALERDAGYVPYVPDEPKEDEEALTVTEATDYLASRTPESEIKTYGIDLPDNVTLTVDQAEKIITDMEAADHGQAALDANEETREWHDDLMGVKPDVKEAVAEAAKETPPPLTNDGLDPEVSAALSNPKIKAAIDQQIGASEAVRVQYSQAVEVANDFARASFIENFPEIAGLPVAQWEGALAAMAQQEPERFNRAMGTLQRVVQLQTAQNEQQAQRVGAERTRLKQEALRFEEGIKSVPKARRDVIEGEIAAAIEERGVGMNDVVTFLRSNEASSSAVMGLLWELGDLRSQLKSIKNAKAAVAAKSLPPVQRPGTSLQSVNRGSDRIQALNRKSELTVKEATELYTLQNQRRA